ncbi:hypothetical protein G9A89_012543 [Geosiphon pyriformis]|nr:hypothetical protein G9A89_012543 [Geosiphon pyriformis]
MLKPLYLFGGKAGWTDEDFNAVDDRVRGGNSTSFLQVTENNTARFYGFLDTTTLGGAGFASQRTTFTSHTWDLCLYTGLTITTRKSDGKTYALNLYTSDRTTRPDGRLESGVEYKYLFTAPADDEEHTFYAKWDEFIPYYRGRPDQKGKKINPGNIKAFSLMLASLFGKQKGDFSIEFVSIVAIRKGSGRKIGRECCGGKGTEKWCVIL